MIDKSKLPYIQMFSVHGLLRAHDMELGRNADTGGQINYVVELGRHLSMRDDIGKVDIFTRLIADKTVSPDYAEPIEVVSDKLRIIRIKCGGRKYIRKELLWPHLDEYIDNTIRFIKQENTIPDLVHGHYADAGYVAGRLADFLGLPFVYTGHSLGQAKFNKLLNESMTKEDIIKKYKINRRIEVEEEILLHADTIITSTQHEIKEQYGLYNNKDAPTYQVIPPGIDIAKFYPFYQAQPKNSFFLFWSFFQKTLYPRSAFLKFSIYLSPLLLSQNWLRYRLTSENQYMAY